MQPTITIALRAARVIAEPMLYLQREMTAEKDSLNSAQAKITRTLEDCLDRAKQILAKAYPDQTIITDDEQSLPEYGPYWQIGGFAGLLDFVRGGHQLSFTIAQFNKGRVEHCLLTFPSLEQHYSASRSRGAQLNDSRLRCRYTEQQADQRLGLSQSFLPPWLEQYPDTDYSCYDNPMLMHACVASGNLDAAITSPISPLNQQCLTLLLQESGAITGQANGNPLADNRRQSLMSGHPKVFKQLAIINQQLLAD